MRPWLAKFENIASGPILHQHRTNAGEICYFIQWIPDLTHTCIALMWRGQKSPTANSTHHSSMASPSATYKEMKKEIRTAIDQGERQRSQYRLRNFLGGVGPGSGCGCCRPSVAGTGLRRRMPLKRLFPPRFISGVSTSSIGVAVVSGTTSCCCCSCCCCCGGER